MSEQTPGYSGGQAGLALCSPWDYRVRHDLVTKQQGSGAQSCREGKKSFEGVLESNSEEGYTQFHHFILVAKLFFFFAPQNIRNTHPVNSSLILQRILHHANNIRSVAYQCTVQGDQYNPRREHIAA